MFEYLARKIPLVTNIPGEAAAFIQKYHCGIVLPPDHNAEDLAWVLSDLSTKREKCAAMGKAGYAVIKESFTRKYFVQRLIEKIQ